MLLTGAILYQDRLGTNIVQVKASLSLSLSACRRLHLRLLGLVLQLAADREPRGVSDRDLLGE